MGYFLSFIVGVIIGITKMCEKPTPLGKEVID